MFTVAWFRGGVESSYTAESESDAQGMYETLAADTRNVWVAVYGGGLCLLTRDLLEAVVTSLKNILQTCHVTSNLDFPIWTYELALTYTGRMQEITIRDARNELLDCIHIEEDYNNKDTAERLRDVYRSSDCRG
jgi:hypothetical protein